MEYILRVKHSQNETHITGKLFQHTYYADDSAVNGIRHGFFVSVKPDGVSTQGFTTYNQATIVETPLDGSMKASGVMYETSRRDQYGRVDNFENEDRYYPYSKREDKAVGLMKECVITISDNKNTKYRHFYTVDTDVPATACYCGQIFEDAATGDIYHITSNDGNGYVEGILESDGTVYDISTKTGKAKGMLGRTLYLSNVPTSDLPFMSYKGGKVQSIGKVASPIAVDVNIAVIA